MCAYSRIFTAEVSDDRLSTATRLQSNGHDKGAADMAAMCAL